MNTSVNVDVQQFFNDFETTFDLPEVALRLQQQGWHPVQAIQAIQQCQQFLALPLLYPHLSMVPDQQTDEVIHLLDEMTPSQNCLEIGKVQFIHAPGLGTRGVEDRQQWCIKSQRTRRLYGAHFGPGAAPEIALEPACRLITEVHFSDLIPISHSDQASAMCELMQVSKLPVEPVLAGGCEIFTGSYEILDARL